MLIFDFVNLWNELFSATLFLDSDKLKTVTIALNGLIQKYDIAWGQLMAGTIVSERKLLPKHIYILPKNRIEIIGAFYGSKTKNVIR